MSVCYVFNVGSRVCRAPPSPLAWRARAAYCKWVTAPPLLLLASMSLAETLLRLIQGEIMGPATPNPLKTHSTARQQAGREAQWSAGWTRSPAERRVVLEDLTSVCRVGRSSKLYTGRNGSVLYIKGCLRPINQALTNQAGVMG